MAIDLGIPDIEAPTEIGRGGFGVVYKAHQARFDRTVAVKVLEQAQLDEAGRQRFERECRALGALSGHPNVVTIYDSGFTRAGWPYLVLEYLPDGSLGDRIDLDGPFDIDHATDLIIKIAGALETAHRSGVLHRDLKPENILLGAYGEPKLGDFGIARVQGSTMTATSTVLGSPAHAAPEIIEGKGASVLTDVYALGSTLYVLLSAKLAFQRDSDDSIIPVLARIATEPPPDLRPLGVPQEVWSIIDRSMSKDPAVRPQTAQAFGRELQAAREALGLGPVEMLVKGEPVTRRHTNRPARPGSATSTPGSGFTPGTTGAAAGAVAAGAYTPQPTIDTPGTGAVPVTPAAASGTYTPPPGSGTYTPQPGGYTPPPGGYTPPPGGYTPGPTPAPRPAGTGGGKGRSAMVWWVLAGVVTLALIGVAAFALTRGSTPPTPPTDDQARGTSTTTAKVGTKKSADLSAALLEPGDVPRPGWKVSKSAGDLKGVDAFAPCNKSLDTSGLVKQDTTILEGKDPDSKDGSVSQVVVEFEDDAAAKAFIGEFASQSSCQQWTDSSGFAHDLVAQSLTQPAGDQSALYEDIVTESGKDFDQDIALYRVGRYVGVVTNLTISPNNTSFSEQLLGAGVDKLQSAGA